MAQEQIEYDRIVDNVKEMPPNESHRNALSHIAKRR